MPLDYTDPGIIKFLKENYEQELERRMAWFQKHRDKIIKAATLPANHKDYRTEDIRRAEVEPSMKDLTAHHKASFSNRRKKPIIDGPIIGISGMKKDIKLQPITNMKPVELEVRNILYEPFPKGGRKQYLNARKRKIPEERYDLFETNNHIIGWRLKDSENIPQGPKFGRYCTFIHDESSRSGPHPDPHHYAPPQKDLYNKCNL